MERIYSNTNVLDLFYSKPSPSIRLRTIYNRRSVFISGTAIVFLILIFASTMVQAKSTTWNKTTGGVWTTAGNWTNGVPAAGDDVTINSDQSAAITGHPAISLTSLTVSGNCNLQSDAGLWQTRLISVTGTFSITAGKTLNLGISGTGRTDFILVAGAIGTISGTLHQYTSTFASRTITVNGNLTISSAGKITGQNSNSNFTLGTGATLQIGSADGITTSGATGNVQSSGTRTYSAGANYVYNGTSAQNTGNGYPTALTGSLTINNAAGITITNAARTISTGTLNLVNGTFATNNGGDRLTLGNNATINRSGGSLTGTLQGTNTYDVNFSGGAKTAGPELQNTGLRNVTVNLNAGATLTSATNAFSTTGNLSIQQGILDMQATNANYTIAGNLSVTSGATLKHSQSWDTYGKQIIVNGNLAINGNYDYSSVARAHIGMYGAGSKTISAPNTALSILTLTLGNISANGNLTINDNFWSMFGTTGSFSTNGQVVTANAGVLINGGTVNINGGTLNVTSELQIGVGIMNGAVNLSNGVLNADYINIGNGTVTGTLTQSGGTANISGNLTIFPSCSYICSNSPSISVAGNWANNGTFTAASSSVSMKGSDGQKIEGTTPTTFNNLEIYNASGSTILGSNQTVNGNLTLTQGALGIGAYTLNLNGAISGTGIGTLTGGNASTLLIGGASGNLGTINFTGGTGTLKTFTINRTGTNRSVTLGSNLTVSAGYGGGTMTITSGVLTLQSGKWLTVDGTLANSTSANFIIESGSSVIQKSAGVNATVKREILAADWGTWDDGWHFLSSPVTAQAISTGGFTTSGAGNDYDFYAWYEPSNLWVNYKNTSVSPTWDQVNGNTNFTVGKGYMAAYQVTSTKEFSGTLNHLDVPVTGLTNNNTTANHSWNLLGNPYPAALTWDNTWSRTNVVGVCQIWNDAIRDYTAVSSGTIPALNGFMVEVTAVSPTTGSITIPATKQTHAVNTWYKSAASEGQLKLTVMAQDNSSGKEAFIQLNPEATELFDLEYDGHYLRGYGPVFYSIAGNDTLSVNTLPAFSESIVIPLIFQKNEGADYVLTVSGVENFEVPIYLTDKKTGVIQNLGYNPVYSFSSVEGDNINRFTLSFKSPTSIKEETEEKFTVSVVNGVITLQSDQSLTGTVKVSDMLGRSIAMENMIADTPLQINLNSTPGVYVVTVYTKSKTYSQKVVIR